MENVKKIQKFIAKFFENLKAELYWDGKILTIKRVPESFEKAYSKKSPYYFVFEEQHKTNETELIQQNSNLISLIRRQLENTGSTTLLKINFDINPLKIINESIIIKNGTLSNIITNKKNNFFYRFTFQTNFQYLNEKEQLINEIYVHKGEIVQGDLSDYPVTEGKKEEVSAKDIENNYALAKEHLKEIIKPKTKLVGEELNLRLEKEIQRITNHYSNQINEIEVQIKKESDRLEFLNQELSKNSERFLIESKIERIKNNIKRIQEEQGLEKIKKEEEFAIKDEKHKYSLNIENRLINTTVIYYPMFTINMTFDNNIKKQIRLEYNPLTKELQKIECNICKKQIKEINLCSEGHIVCDNCSTTCKECGEEFCKNCIKKKCEFCDKPLCSKCAKTCKFCGKTFCKTHLQKDILGNVGCVNCLRPCQMCNEYSEPRYLKKNAKGKMVCSKCYSKELGKKIVDNIFENN